MMTDRKAQIEAQIESLRRPKAIGSHEDECLRAADTMQDLLDEIERLNRLIEGRDKLIESLDKRIQQLLRQPKTAGG